jgi:hypothetical protein
MLYISRVATAGERLGRSRCLATPHLERLEKLEILIRNTNRDSRSGMALFESKNQAMATKISDNGFFSDEAVRKGELIKQEHRGAERTRQLRFATVLQH